MALPPIGIPGKISNSTDPKSKEIDKVPLVQMKATHLPSYRAQVALKDNKLREVMLVTRGGLGDAVCSEPVIRFALQNFEKPFSLSVICRYPELYQHLAVKQVFVDSKDLKIYKPDYFWVTTYPVPNSLEWDFFCPPFCNTLDAMSIAAFKCMLPVQEKDIQLAPNPAWHQVTKEEKIQIDRARLERELVVIHPGATWQSRTFPVEWWQEVIEGVKSLNLTPVIIGAAARQGVGTVPVDTKDCIDLRDRTSLEDFIAICQKATVLLTNDSSPIHMASSTDPREAILGSGYGPINRPWIGMVATCRHPDFISHWRKNEKGVNEWQYRTVNLGVDGLWNHADYYLRKEPISLEHYDYELVKKSLPEPEAMVAFTRSKIRNEFYGL